MSLTYATTDYNTTLFNLLKDVEGAIKPAYLDAKGLPSIGIGFNLKGNPALRGIGRLGSGLAK